MDQQIHNQVMIGWTMVALFLAILVVHRTALLGFTMFAAFMIASSSHSALLWAHLTGIPFYWVTPYHIEVFNYCGIGMLLFGVGVWIAWKPIRTRLRTEPSVDGTAISGSLSPSWLTPQFVLLCMCIGAAGYLLTPLTSGIPTVHAVWAIFFSWMEVGVLIAGFYGATTRKYKVLLLSLSAFLPLGLLRTVSDGHAGALGYFTLQFALVFLLARKVRLWQLSLVATVLLLLGPMASAWFKVRDFIRTGHIQGNPIQKVMTFTELFSMYYEPFNVDNYDMLEILQLRIDMSGLLADQVRQQPFGTPYQYGRTITDTLLVALVPRILWPDKPVHFGGSEFISKYTGRVYEGSTSVNTPVQLEFYANVGPTGAMVLLGLFGYLCARLEMALFRRDFRDMPKLLRMFCYTLVASTTGSQLTLTIMRLIPGLLGIWMAGRVIETIRRTMRVDQDFLTPLPVRKKVERVVVVGEEHGQTKAALVRQAPAAVAAAEPGLHPAPYGFRPWSGRPGKAPL